jgi:hypothetical protein
MPGVVLIGSLHGKCLMFFRKGACQGFHGRVLQVSIQIRTITHQPALVLS